jgi:hypothetical protein
MYWQFQHCAAYRRVSIVPVLALTKKDIGIFSIALPKPIHRYFQYCTGYRNA